MSKRAQIGSSGLTDETFQRLLAEYQWAEAACDAGDGDFDLLWARWDATRRAIDVYLRSLRGQETRERSPRVPLWLLPENRRGRWLERPTTKRHAG
jgi:hypothetical protein